MMLRFYILFGFAFMFGMIHYQGQINKYINTKYAYLSISAIAILGLLSVVEVANMYRKEQADNRKKREAELAAGISTGAERGTVTESCACGDDDHGHDRSCGDQGQAHADGNGNDHDHDHGEHDPFGHSHEPKSRWKRGVGYLILSFPIFTGLFLPVQTLDSSFVKAKGFSFPSAGESMSADNPGQHQFLKPDSSVFYGKEGYDIVKNRELSEFADRSSITLDDDNYMKGMEVIYNFPGDFMGRTISFEGFAYRGEQVDGDHYFVFRFGFIHCAADSGVFGMLVDFPKGTKLEDDDWVRVTGKLSSELYQPFKQTIPVLRVTSWTPIDAPEDPYVYRIY